MTNRPRSHLLYTGVTGNLLRRVLEHKNKLLPGFTSRYNFTRSVHYECFAFPDAAIDREKEIKGWRTEQEDSPYRVHQSTLARLGRTSGRCL